MGNGVAVQKRPGPDGSAEEMATVPNQDIVGLARVAEAKNKFMKTKEKKERLNAFKQIHGTNFIKEMYRRLDPTVCLPNAIDITGEIQIAIKYNLQEKLLLLKLIQARHLVSRDVIGYSDPYAVVKIVPDRYNEGAKKTRKKIRTLNPIFQEIVSFALEERDIPETNISVDLFDHDIVGTDDFMGQAVVDISRMNLSNGLSTNRWFLLQQQTDFSVTGEVEVTLYHELDNLFVTIHKAKDLGDPDCGASSTYMSVHIPFTTQHKNTKIVNENISPDFEETFEFDMPLQDLCHRTVLLHLYHVTDEEKEKHLGDVTINLKRCSPGEATRNWYRVSDLSNTARERTHFGERAVSQEFREAMFAHTLYHCPSFVFKADKTGKKVYTVTCRQAATSSKMVLVNGTPLR